MCGYTSHDRIRTSPRMQNNTSPLASALLPRSLPLGLSRPALFLLSLALPVTQACTTDLDPGEESAIELDAPSPTESKIVGGTSTTIASYPWQVSVQSSFGSHFCGGSIVSPTYVVTAQHCVDGESASSLRVVAGITQLSQAATGQIRTVAQIIRAPGYSSPENGKDIALLRLSTALDLSGANAKAIPIATPDDVTAGRTNAGVVAQVSGWGSLSSGGSSPNTLQVVSVPVVSNTSAQNAYSQETITSDQLAAGSAGKDSCQGDSGGPLIVAGANGPILAGVVSWGYGCGSATYPGMYARVSSFTNWITSNSDVSTTPGGTEPPPPPPPPGDDDVTTLNNVSGAQGSFQHWTVEVPAGATGLDVVLSGGTGDADLYVRRGAQPTTSSYDCRPYLDGNNETCSFSNPQSGTWYVSVRGYTAFSGASLAVTVRADEGTGGGGSTGGGPVVLASDDFASGTWGGGSGFTSSWVRSGDTALSEGGARLRRSTGDIQRTVNVAGVTGLSLSFQSAVASFESNDTAVVRVSTNGGSSWTTVKTFGQADSNSTWTPNVIDLSQFDGASTLTVRFDANMNATTDYFFVDDVTVAGID